MAQRILLGQLGAKGDSLYATILARQLRHDFPDAEITWAIFDQNSELLENNQHIDNVWRVPLGDRSQTVMMWNIFEREALARVIRREFDRFVFSQINPNNFQNYDGTIRPSMLRAYGAPITVPIENVIDLTDDEISRVEDFARTQSLDEFQHRILFECTAQSGQSFVNTDIAQEIAAKLYERLPNATVIFTTHLPMQLRDERSRYAGTLTLRETAHLTKHCTLFVGSGSGGTVAASSTSSKALPMIQLLKKSTSVYASFAHDFEYFGIADRTVLEMTNEDPAYIAECFARVCRDGIDKAFDEFDSRIAVKFDHYFKSIEQNLLFRHRYLDGARSLLVTAKRYGWTKELINFGAERILPNLRLDPSWLFPDTRRLADELNVLIAEAGKAPADAPQQGRWATDQLK
ncbi:MAG: glycosyltransferase family 9 protein [Parvibaculaceae bacterium]